MKKKKKHIPTDAQFSSLGMYNQPAKKTPSVNTVLFFCVVIAIVFGTALYITLACLTNPHVKMFGISWK